ncbi:MAG TPA: hypothetical protein VNQ52_05045 [Microbacteriaceae bacterium]|nr:hypothetical protein [Microbacteriaceae bacterium]
MAGRTLSVDMQDDDLIPAWTTAIELGHASELDYASASSNDRKRVDAVTSVLASQSHTAWVNLDKQDRRQGQLNLVLIGQGLRF